MQLSPESAPEHDQDEESDSAPGRSYAGLGRRLAAFVLDLAMALISVLIPVFVILRLLNMTGAWVPTGEAEYAHQSLSLGKFAIGVGAFLACGPIYRVLWHASPWQATCGKRILGIYVTGDDARRIGLARSLGREIALYIFNVLWLGLISFITIAASERRKGMHDFVARTCVLRGRPAPGGAIGWWRIAAAAGLPVVWVLGSFLLTM
jgi:uncharacterized RDD family membrane protein YckC